MPRRKRIIKNPPFDTKCKYKHCDRKIPKSFIYCSSECRRKDLGIITPKYISTRNAKKILPNVKKTPLPNVKKTPLPDVKITKYISRRNAKKKLELTAEKVVNKK